MFSLLLAYLIGIMVAINFNGYVILIAMLMFVAMYYFAMYKRQKIANGRFISKNTEKTEKLELKLFILCAVILISYWYTNFRIQQYDNKYTNSEVSGDFTVISKDSVSDYYNKYLCKNTFGDKFILKVNKKVDIGMKEGNEIFLNGKFKQGQLARNEGGFNYRRYLNSKNIYGTITVNENCLELKKEGKIGFISKIKQHIENTFLMLLPGNYAGIINGMLNGQTKGVSEDILEDFKNSGVTHLLAVSGSNIAYIIMFLSLTSNKIFGKYMSYYVIIVSIIIFIFVSGASASVARAGIMAILNIIAVLLSKKSNTLNNIFFSALILLCINPLTLYDVGFILSFVGTFGIVTISKVLTDYIKKYLKNKFVSETIGITLSAQIMLTPIMIYYFNTFSLISLITNFLIVPISGFLTTLGFITVLISIFSIKIARIVAYAIYSLTYFMFCVTNFFGNISWANLIIPTPKIWMMLTYYVLLFIFIKYVNCRKKAFVVIGIIAILYVCIIKIPRNYIKVNMIDIGQGDSTYIETKNRKVILIDGGGTEGSDYDVGENILLPYILDQGKMVVDLVIVSHPHEDHIEGIFTLLEKIKVKKVLISENVDNTELGAKLIKLCKSKKTEVIRVAKGDDFVIDGIEFSIIFPSRKDNEENLNNMSILMKMEYSGVKILFTGDLEKEKEEHIKGDLTADILKVGHHGSTTSTSEKFLKKVMPQIALISVGEDNSYGHPNQKVLDRLKKYNVKVYRTDIDGEIKLKIKNNGKISLNVMNKKRETN